MSKKSEEYLENKRCDFDLITVEHAKTYGKIVELETEISNTKKFIAETKSYRSATPFLKHIKMKESEIERLMKL